MTTRIGTSVGRPSGFGFSLSAMNQRWIVANGLPSRMRHSMTSWT
jgi:hypothetical protein